MVDVVTRVSGPLHRGSDTPGRIDFRGGGAAANVAAWLASTGTSATFVGRVGADAAGRAAVDELRAGGVHTAVSFDPDRSTGACVVLVDDAGERTMIPHSGANSGLGEVDAATALPAAADCLYVSGYALFDPGSRPFARAALALARSRGWAVAVDAASAAPLAAVGPAAVLDWLGTGLVLFANDQEARVLAGSTGPAAAAALAATAGEAVVKSGAGGATWCGDGRTEHVDAVIGAAEVVDTTGAGDAFAAGFLHTRLADGDVPGCLRAGAELAARAVRTPGARPVRV